MQNSVKKCSRCNGTGMTSDFLGYYEYPCDCRRAVPYQAPPPGDYPPLPKPAHRPYIDDNGNVRAHGGYSDEQLMLYLATDRAQRIEPALETPAAPVGEHYDELHATLMGLRVLCENISGMERQVGPLGSHARGYTWKITAALRHLDALAAAPQAPAAPVALPDPLRGLLIRCREFIDTTKNPPYPVGADIADEIDAALAATPAAAPDSESVP